MWITTAVAQEAPLPTQIRFEHIGIETGLAASLVNDIVQDSEGFMWFGSVQGLDRFDGYDFVNFGANPNRPNRDLGRNRVLSLYAAPDNMLWIGSDQLTRYDAVHDTLRSFQVTEGDGIFALAMAADGNLWFGGHESGLRLFDPVQEKTIAVYLQPNNEGRSNTINDIAIAADGLIWLATEQGTFTFDPLTAVFDPLTHHTGIEDVKATDIAIDRYGQVWISTWDGLYRYTDGDLLHFSGGQIPFEQIHSILVDSQDRIWMGSDKQGVAVYDPVTADLRHYPADDEGLYAMRPGAVDTIFEDADGSLWFAVNGYGLYRYSASNQLFDLYPAEPDNVNGLQHGQINAIVVDPAETAWIATDGGGLYALEQASEQMRLYKHDEENTNSLRSDAVIGLASDKDGHLWIGSWAGGLSRLDPQTGQFTHWNSKDGSGLLTDNIFALYIDSKEQLWISAWDKGLQVFDLASETMVASFLGNAPTSDLQNINVMAILESRDGTMWFGGYRGLEHYDPATGEIRYFKQADTTTGTLLANTVFALHEDDEGMIWLGTDAGLHRLDPQTNTLTYFTVSDGLPSNSVVGILADSEGDLWLSTQRGVSLFRRATNSFQNYTADNGLQGGEFNRFSAFAANGLLYFGGVNGMNRFDPLILKQRAQVAIPRIELTGFLLNNELQEPAASEEIEEAINFSEAVILDEQTDSFSLQFSAVEYTTPDQIRYRYYLENFDDTWHETDSKQRIASYTNLAPGRYYFHVQALSPDGTAGSAQATIEIVATPHWWETGLFQGVLLGIGVLAIFGLYRLRVRNVLRAIAVRQKEREAKIYRQKSAELQQLNQHLKQANQEKDDLLALVIHDLRTPLTALNTDVQNLKYGPSPNVLNRIGQSVTKMSALVDKLLRDKKKGVIEANLQPVAIAAVLQAAMKQLEGIAAKKQITINDVWRSHAGVMVLADALLLEQVLDNLLSNAIKYSHVETAVTIFIEQINQEVYVSVQDEGLGMSEEDLQKVFGRYTKLSARPTQGEDSAGLGLYNVKKMMAAMDGVAFAESPGQGEGSTFTIVLTAASAE